MTGKTVNFYRGIRMTTLTKLAFLINAYRPVCSIGLCMTGNALGQTKRLIANAAYDGIVALVIKQVHVLATHEVRVSHALATFALWYYRPVCSTHTSAGSYH